MHLFFIANYAPILHSGLSKSWFIFDNDMGKNNFDFQMTLEDGTEALRVAYMIIESMESRL